MSSRKSTQKQQAGFSLIELLIVVMVIGVVAAIGSPVLHDARISAQRSAALSSLRRIHGAEAAYRLSYSRYANMQDLNTFQSGGLGQNLAADKIYRSGYTYQWLSALPTVANVETGFTIQASGHNSAGDVETYVLSANGSISQVLPVVRDIVKFN